MPIKIRNIAAVSFEHQLETDFELRHGNFAPLEMLNDESEAKVEKMRKEYMVDITSKNDLLERLNKSVAESETKFEKVKQEYEANYNEMLDISRKNQEKANSEMEIKIEKIKEEYQARICSENCKSSELEMLKTKIQNLENSNFELNKKLEGTTEILNDKQNKLKLQNDLRQKTTKITNLNLHQ